jgi:NitT/TauT family transport system permease protein
MPKVAIAPLLLLWFGFGVASKVAIAALLAFFPLLVNTALGLHASDPQQEELMHSLAAQRWQIFVMVRLRNALPSIFAGLELAMVFSVIGAIVGEFVGARGGLGYMIQQRNANVDVAGILSVLLILGIVGAVLTYCVKIVDHYVVFWNHRK